MALRFGKSLNLPGHLPQRIKNFTFSGMSVSGQTVILTPGNSLLIAEIQGPGGISEQENIIDTEMFYRFLRVDLLTRVRQV